MKVDLQINGKAIHLEDVDPDMPLLWVLRDRLGLTGTKYSCGMAICGTCLVLVGDEALPSCSLKVSDVADRAVTTIEGLGAVTLHAVQRAWIEKDVSQCGYCQPGQILGAVALLKSNPDPSDQEIDVAMHRCLCRCGAYPRIREAIHRAAVLLREEGPAS